MSGDAWIGMVWNGYTPSEGGIEFHDGAGRALVHPDEAFTAEEAGEIFVHYFHTLTVPDHYVLREVDLTPPTP